MATILLNAAIGIVASWFVSAISPKPQTTTGKLDDLLPPKASADEPIARIEGSIRTPGVFIWARPKIERLEGNTYKYYGNFAVLFCEGAIAAVRRVWINGKLVYSTHPSEAVETVQQAEIIRQQVRFYLGTGDQLPDPLIEAIEGKDFAPAYRHRAYAVFDNYPLPEGQWPSISVEVCKKGYYDADGRFIDTPPTYAEAIANICQAAGIASDQYDVSQVWGNFYGFAQSSAGEEYRQGIEQLINAGLITVTESSGRLKFVSHPVPYVRWLSNEDCSWAEAKTGKPLKISQQDTDSLPGEIWISAPDPTINYGVGVSTAIKPGDNINKNRMQLAAALLPSQRQRIADITLQDLWISKTSYQFNLTYAHADLEVGDAIGINNDLVLITKIDQGANYLLSCEGRAYSATLWGHQVARQIEICETITPKNDVWTISRRYITRFTRVRKLSGQTMAPGVDYNQDINEGFIAKIASGAITSGEKLLICFEDDEDSIPPSINKPNRKLGSAQILDIPVPWDSYPSFVMNSPNSDYESTVGGIAYLAYESGALPKAAVAWHSSIDGVNYAPVTSNGAAQDNSSGRLLAQMPYWGTDYDPWRWKDIKDTTNVIHLRLTNPQNSFASCTPAEIAQGRNIILIGNEILQFEQAVPQPDGSYKLSQLHRGRRGTEWAMLENRPAGTRAIGIDASGSTIQRWGIGGLDTTQLDKNIYVKFLDASDTSEGTNLAGKSPVVKRFARINAQPFAPQYPKAVELANNDYTITWERRDRRNNNGSSCWNHTGQLSEDRREFVLQWVIPNSEQVIRTVSLSHPSSFETILSYTYTTAQQIADYGSTITTQCVLIFQVGRHGRWSKPCRLTYN